MMIHCQNIELTFSGKKIFDKLNLFIEKGENVCLSGPSGKGKSTLLKMIQGYITPDNGHILINNTMLSTTTIKELRESIAWIPQNINLPVNNGWELLNLLHIQSNIELVNEFIEKLGLEKDIISKDFNKISGGQKQRIIISICLSLNKKIILMDEPTASLDDVSIKLLIKTLKSLNGKTIVSASHNHLWVNNTDKIIQL
jgi:polar amino acid transport system ATP-binding protein/putative ABC transport system ATP-binding protein